MGFKKKKRKSNFVAKIGFDTLNVKEAYCEAGMINIYSTKSLLNNLDRYFPYEIPLSKSVDIDTLEDLELAKVVQIER